MNSLIEFQAYLSGKSIKHKWYYDVACSFDIETTEFTTFEGETANYCYYWTFCIDEILYRSGRDPEEFFQFLKDLNLNKKLIVYVHWLTYEYRNLKWLFDKYITTFDIEYDTKNNKEEPIIIRGSKVVFKDSFVLSNRSSLYDIGKSIGLPKLELDYGKKRNRKTYMSDSEKDYGYRDVQIVCRYIKYLCEDLNLEVHELERTSAGLYKKILQKKGYHKGIREKNSQGRYFPENSKNCWKEDDFDKFHKALKGGLIVNNKIYLNKKINNVLYADAKSAYPYLQARYMFPYKFSHVYDTSKDNQWYRINDINRQAVLAKFTFTNLDLKEDAPCDILKGKYEFPIDYSAYMTNLEFKIFEMYYDYDSVEWEDFQVAELRPLSKIEVETNLELFEKKEKARGTDFYGIKKQLLNSGYGHKCVDIDKYDLTINDCDFYYPEGVWIPAWQRYIMATLIWKIGRKDFIYSNTDSVFCKDNERTRKILEEYNNLIPFEKLGKFEFNKIKSFYIINASRYIKIYDNDEIEVCISGARKDSTYNITMEDFINYSNGGLIVIKDAKSTYVTKEGDFKGFIDGEEVETRNSIILTDHDIVLTKMKSKESIVDNPKKLKLLKEKEIIK